MRVLGQIQKNQQNSVDSFLEVSKYRTRVKSVRRLDCELHLTSSRRVYRERKARSQNQSMNRLLREIPVPEHF